MPSSEPTRFCEQITAASDTTPQTTPQNPLLPAPIPEQTHPMTINRMKSSDLPHILELNRQLGYASTLMELQNRFRKVDTNPTHAIFVARDDENTTQGYAHIHHDPESLLENERAILHALVGGRRETQRSTRRAAVGKGGSVGKITRAEHNSPEIESEA